MTRKLLIATHSTLADGIRGALALLAGEQDRISTLCAYVEQITEVETPIREIISVLRPDEELVVLTDVFGGSVNNEFMKYLQTGKLHLISGVNLSLAVEIAMALSLPEEEFVKAVKAAIEIAKEQIQYCNELIGCRPEEDNF